MHTASLYLAATALALLLVLPVHAFFAPVADCRGLSPDRAIHMKMFDWKIRNGRGEAPLDEPISLSNIYRLPGSNKRKQRVGRGHAAGQGGSSGRGMKGQNARSGGSKGAGFEGGQTPLLRGSPKWPRKPPGIRHRRTIYNVIKTDHLNLCGDGAVVTYQYLLEREILQKARGKPIHKVVLGKQPLTARNQVVYAHAYTNAACQAILDNGGKCFMLSRTTHKPISEITRAEQLKSIWADEDDENADDDADEAGGDEELDASPNARDGNPEDAGT